ncbi:MAG: phospholipid scramblase-related protein [Nanoarchaeota archaeon]|nr:phospholipid scramblase-related protein [Nanoarchaeota archaeon]
MGKFVIKQEVEVAEILTGFETRNQYSVNDEQGNKLMHAYEESGFFLNQIFGRRRNLRLDLIDLDKNNILSIKRPFYFFNCSATVYLSNGDILGHIKQKKWLGNKKFDFLDANGNLVFSCVLKLPHIWTFNIFKDEQFVAQILKKWSKSGKEIFTDSDNFLVDFGEIEDSSFIYSILAMAFIIDLRVFEKRS